jgi:ribosome biogenesis GTPase
MDLRDLGYRDLHADAFAALARPELVPVRVVRCAADIAWTFGVAGAGTARVPRALHRARDHRGEPVWPVSGDWLAVDPSGTVAAALPRHSRFVRKAAGMKDEAQIVAANIDRALLLMGLDQDFNLRRLERYLALAAQCGAAAAVVLTKAAVGDDVPARVESVRAIAGAAPVLAVDVPAGLNTDALDALAARGETLALVGSSGVGKSTLVNHLMGGDVAATGAVRSNDDRGRHTTTRRELFWTPGGAAVIDTPGMRELGLWADAGDVDGVFEDIAAVAGQCRFRDCTHAREPGCAVRAAVDTGALPADRVRAWCALRDELSAQAKRRGRR